MDLAMLLFLLYIANKFCIRQVSLTGDFTNYSEDGVRQRSW
jgi:hypothetical protein